MTDKAFISDISALLIDLLGFNFQELQGQDSECVINSIRTIASCISCTFDTPDKQQWFYFHRPLISQIIRDTLLNTDPLEGIESFNSAIKAAMTRSKEL